ncbi:hypothetical protein STEG23_031541 [Scotinomys teguina]
MLELKSIRFQNSIHSLCRESDFNGSESAFGETGAADHTPKPILHTDTLRTEFLQTLRNGEAVYLFSVTRKVGGGVQRSSGLQGYCNPILKIQVPTVTKLIKVDVVGKLWYKIRVDHWKTEEKLMQSVKNCVGILMEIVLNLWIAFETYRSHHRGLSFV